MIVDCIKGCYIRKMRIRLEPELIVPVRWYFTPPGAQLLPADTAFGSILWETDERDYPQPGLGEVSKAFKMAKNQPPPGVTGQGTRTPLDWFLHGLPADFVYPPPHGEVLCLIDLRQVLEDITMPGPILTDEGAVAFLAEELPHIVQWQFLLFVWPATISDTTIFADLQEANFPGYARQSPTWGPSTLSGPNQAATWGSTLTWTRSATGTPQTIFGWAAVGPGLPVQLRSVQLLPTPITLANAGDNVTLCPVLLIVGVCLGQPPAGAQLGRLGGGANQRSRQAVGNLQRGQLGGGANQRSPQAGGAYQLGQLAGGALHASPPISFTVVSDGASYRLGAISIDWRGTNTAPIAFMLPAATTTNTHWGPFLHGSVSWTTVTPFLSHSALTLWEAWYAAGVLTLELSWPGSGTYSLLEVYTGRLSLQTVPIPGVTIEGTPIVGAPTATIPGFEPTTAGLHIGRLGGGGASEPLTPPLVVRGFKQLGRLGGGAGLHGPQLGLTAAVLYDTFTGTAGTRIGLHTPNVGGPWTETTLGLQLDGAGNLLGSRAIVQQFAIAPGAADLELAYSILWGGDASQVFAHYRYLNGSNRWTVGFDSTTWSLVKRIAGVPTTVASGSWSPAGGTRYNVRLSAIGSAIRLSLDGTTLASVSDSALASNTVVGLSLLNSAAVPLAVIGPITVQGAFAAS